MEGKLSECRESDKPRIRVSLKTLFLTYVLMALW